MLARVTCSIANHDDVIKWKHFPRYCPFVRRIHRSPMISPPKGQWRGALMFSLIYARINGWVNNGEAGDSRRHRAHYDITVMYPNAPWFFTFISISRSISLKHLRKCLHGTRQYYTQNPVLIYYTTIFLYIYHVLLQENVSFDEVVNTKSSQSHNRHVFMYQWTSICPLITFSGRHDHFNTQSHGFETSRYLLQKVTA